MNITLNKSISINILIKIYSNKKNMIFCKICKIELVFNFLENK